MYVLFFVSEINCGKAFELIKIKIKRKHLIRINTMTNITLFVADV